MRFKEKSHYSGAHYVHTLSPVKRDGELPAGNQYSWMECFHWLIIRCHYLVFANDLKHNHFSQHVLASTSSDEMKCRTTRHCVKDVMRGVFTQQRAKWSCSSAKRRPMHIRFPMPNGTWENGFIEFFWSQRSGLNWVQPLKYSSLEPKAWVFIISTVYKQSNRDSLNLELA